MYMHFEVWLFPFNFEISAFEQKKQYLFVYGNVKTSLKKGFSSFYPNDSLVHSVILLWKHTDAFDMARFR